MKPLGLPIRNYYNFYSSWVAADTVCSFFFFPFMAVVLHGATHFSFTGHRRISDSRVPQQAVFKLAPPQL